MPVKQGYSALTMGSSFRGKHLVSRGISGVNAVGELGFREDAQIHIHLLHGPKGHLQPPSAATLYVIHCHTYNRPLCQLRCKVGQRRHQQTAVT